ncbi:MAG: MFS transporter [Acidobacteria bacterium]|nr:MAG: MFS transporter [Acidobacteriota bacterium]
MVMTRRAWRMILLASLGGTLEYYDFVIFGIFAAQIGRAFFPSQDPLVSLMVTFTTFAIGYLARPIGGLVLGRLGDKFGRRGVFLASIFVTSAATLGIGIVPTYASWGIAASVTVVLLRLTQGFCLGGELPGAITYVVESAKPIAPFVCSVVFGCVTLGVALGTTIALIVGNVLTPAEAAVYGWRIAFIIGGLLGLASFWLRRSFEESPEFVELKRLERASQEPIGELARTHAWQIFVGIAAQAVTAVFAGLFFAYMPAYLTAVSKYDASTATFAQTYGVVLHAALIVFVGWLADHYPPHLLLRIGAIVLAVGAYPFYAALSAHSVNIIALMTIAALTGAFVNGTFAFVTADLFPTRIRFSGVAVVQNISQTAFGGTAPLIATALVRDLQSPVAPALVVIACGVMTFVGSFWAARAAGRVRVRTAAAVLP